MITTMKAIISQLYKDTGIRVIQANLTAPRPPLPFVVYNVTAPYIKGVGLPDITSYEDETGFHFKHSEQYRVTLSFNGYTSNNETTIDLINKVRQWFLFMGRDFIEEQNVAVIEVGNIENRTTFLVDSYEYKCGFDVQFRLTEEITKPIEWIETTVLNREE